MFNVGEVVMHNKQGLYTISELTNIYDMDYYVLTSDKNSAKVMVPVNNADRLIRKPITKGELDTFLNNLSCSSFEFEDDFKLRIKKYNEMLKSSTAEDLIVLLNTINKYKKEHGKMTTADKDILTRTKNILYDELSYVLGVKDDEVEDYLLKK